MSRKQTMMQELLYFNVNTINGKQTANLLNICRCVQCKYSELCAHRSFVSTVRVSYFTKQKFDLRLETKEETQTRSLDFIIFNGNLSSKIRKKKNTNRNVIKIREKKSKFKITVNSKAEKQ
jgi:hypothetical protein